MTHDERTVLIESYGRAYDDLVAALDEVPREMWLFKPAPEKWSVHEVIVHIADSEANSYVRCRRFIAEPGTSVMAYDENKWASALRYHDQSADDALELFRLLRASCHSLIRDLPESVWANTIEHPENGTMTFDDWLRTYERHIPVHVAQIRRNVAAWEDLEG
jgi:hypothetical protein